MRKIVTRLLWSAIVVVLGPLTSTPVVAAGATVPLIGNRRTPHESVVPPRDGRTHRRNTSLRILMSCTGGGESISPCTQSVTLAALAQTQRTFMVENDGIEDDNMATGCSRSGAVASCSASPTSLSIPHGGATRAFTVTFTAGATGGSGTVSATGSGNGDLTATVSATVTVPVDTFAVAVAPKGGDTLTVTAAHVDTTRFSVHNNGNTQATFSLAASCSGAAFPSGCAVSPDSLVLAAGDSQPASVTFTAGANATAGRANLIASQSSPSSPTTVDTGWVNVAAMTPPPACSTMLSSIVPCTIALSAHTKRSDLQQDFWITNHNHLEGVSYFLSVTHTGAVTSDSVFNSVFVKSDSTARVTVFYSTADTAGSGTFTLVADDGEAPVTGTATVTVSATPPTPFMHAHV